ncbi:MAG: hypothetical protein O2960_19350 [Verrucomicrobia bacterium]|nr:hypothetical protein [Verrucomicrobiota bacterium]
MDLLPGWDLFCGGAQASNIGFNLSGLLGFVPNASLISSWGFRFKVAPSFLDCVGVGQTFGVVEEQIQKSAHPTARLNTREKNVRITKHPHLFKR